MDALETPPRAAARLTTLFSFPENYFLENLAVRADNSLLITVLNHRQLWFVPAVERGAPEALLLCSFDQPAMGIVEVEPEVFLVCTSNLWGDHASFLHRLDLRSWAPGRPVDIAPLLRMPEPVRGLNGACLVAPGVALVADSFAGLVWRVDLSPGATRAEADVWLRHDSMASSPHGKMPDQPGINGLAFAPVAGMLYYTSTAQQLVMRVGVEALGHAPRGTPEFVADGMMGDDLCVDEAAGVAYVATHRQNSIDRVPLQAGTPGRARESIAGNPFTEELLGPTTGRWGRLPSQAGRVAFFLTDGGIKAPMPDGRLRPARVLRVDLAP